MIPLVLKTGDFVAPGQPAYYLVAANGAYLVKNTRLFSSVTESKVIAGLEPESPSLRLAFGKVPRQLLEKIYGFFQFVYDRVDGEAIVFLYYCPERAEFHVEAPPQWVTRYRCDEEWRTRGSLEYRAIPRPPGFLKLGDAHSHGDSSAFFSRIDDRDDGEDGLRIVIGRLDRAWPDVCVSFVANGTRFELEPNDVLEDFNLPLLPPPVEWSRRVRCRYEDRGQRIRQSGYAHEWR